jgi:hypothetical protein
MIEPMEKNGSASLKKFKTPVCGQLCLVSMLVPLATRTQRGKEKRRRSVPVAGITRDVGLFRSFRVFGVERVCVKAKKGPWQSKDLKGAYATKVKKSSS